eukprot:SAG31_NODE_144_length_22617_cov_21.520117_9_plen_71_part_00
MLSHAISCYLMLSHTIAAFATFDEAVQCDPDHWESFFQRGLAKHVFKVGIGRRRGLISHQNLFDLRAGGP